MTSLDDPRRGTIPTALANLRDVGAVHPGLIRGVLLRSDAPLPGDDHDGYAVAWPPRTVVDLRDPGEAAHDHPLRAVAQVHALPVMGGSALTPRDLPTSLAELYLGMLAGPAAGWLVKAVHEITHGETPVLVHCTAGKDRTGVTIALVLRLVGIPDAEIVADYTATGPGMEGVMARAAETLRRHLHPDALASVPADLNSAPPEAIAGFLRALDEYDGGATAWYLTHGGDQATLTALRSRLRSRD